MDLYRAIRELYEEKRRIEEAIASLEQLLASKSAAGVFDSLLKKRRGRKSMGPEERRMVSERMKKYWAQRRARGADKDERGRN
ncbi:MAG: hypothetical protein K6T59_07610 [Bryobacteraceae bacterium]|jgi:hypothetical protein|nr:hypothetical protein [Bryobacteraceae bacterium]